MPIFRVQRRERRERYTVAVPSKEWPRGWLVMLVQSMSVMLDGYITQRRLQDLANCLDYGPNVALSQVIDEEGEIAMRLDDRRTRAERYVVTVPAAEWLHDWLISVVSFLDSILDPIGPGAHQFTLQELVEMLDYGPYTLSPRMYKEFMKIKDAFDRAVAETDEKCKRGDHVYRDRHCIHCGEPALKVVEP